jgi:hypothetical protein
MRKPNAFALCVLLCAFLGSAAQDTKIPLNEPDYHQPRIFTDLPERMSLTVNGMDSVFNLAIGKTVRAQATDNLLIEGVIVSKSDERDQTIKSVVIRLTNRPGAVFTFTRTINADGSAAYIGRIISRKNGDAYELKQENGQYVLLKKNINDMMSE